MGRKRTLTKTQSITVRLAPKLRYGLELLARKQHRNLSEVISWIVHCSIEADSTIADILKRTWHIDEDYRIQALKDHAPGLLTYDEEVWLQQPTS